MLKENQLEAIDYLVTNTHTKEEISKLCGTSPRTLYRWMNDEEFKAEWRKRTEAYQSGLKKEVQNCMMNKVSMAMQNIWNLANNSDSDKIKFDANVFIYESQMGKATTKIEQTTNENKDNNNTKVDIKEMISEIELDNNNNDKDNIIELNVKKAK